MSRDHTLPLPRIVLATRNEGKARELADLLAPLASRIESLRDHPPVEIPPETGSSYLENAQIKARAIYACLGVPVIGDDSGLEVDALGGAPGLMSARYAGPRADDAANVEQLLRNLIGTPLERRNARFRCVLALRLSTEEVIIAEGTCEGSILTAPRGTGGFGYDPVFMPVGESLTFAELPEQTKNRLSHRARAAEALLVRILGKKHR